VLRHGDHRLYAKLGEPEVRHVSAPPTLMRPWTVPMPHARYLMYTGDLIDGRETERIHLVNKAVASDRLMPEAKRLARKCARMPGAAIKFANLRNRAQSAASIPAPAKNSARKLRTTARAVALSFSRLSSSSFRPSGTPMCMDGPTSSISRAGAAGGEEHRRPIRRRVSDIGGRARRAQRLRDQGSERVRVEDRLGLRGGETGAGGLRPRAKRKRRQRHMHEQAAQAGELQRQRIDAGGRE
jgi:hypothetical protein